MLQDCYAEGKKLSVQAETLTDLAGAGAGGGEGAGAGGEGQEVKDDFIKVVLIDRVARPRRQTPDSSSPQHAKNAENSLIERAKTALARASVKTLTEEGEEEREREREREEASECLNLFRHERLYRKLHLCRAGFFERILSAEFSSSRQLEVSLRDKWTSADAMAAALVYLEEGQLVTGDFDMLQIFVASRLLAIPDLSSLAAQELGSCLQPASLARAIHHAREYRSAELQRACLEFLLHYLSTAANIVQGMLVDSAAQQELLLQLRTLPHDTVRLLPACSCEGGGGWRR
eukprot:746522-Hanusia_phi.AAC.19